MRIPVTNLCFPDLERAGVKTVIHGPFTFAPDGNPLVGPVPGIRNYWAACAVMAGFSQGGGVGLTLAQWMVEGEPLASYARRYEGLDRFFLDGRRFRHHIETAFCPLAQLFDGRAAQARNGDGSPYRYASDADRDPELAVALVALLASVDWRRGTKLAGVAALLVAVAVTGDEPDVYISTASPRSVSADATGAEPDVKSAVEPPP